jgi:hypothetical protein
VCFSPDARELTGIAAIVKGLYEEVGVPEAPLVAVIPPPFSGPCYETIPEETEDEEVAEVARADVASGSDRDESARVSGGDLASDSELEEGMRMTPDSDVALLVDMHVDADVSEVVRVALSVGESEAIPSPLSPLPAYQVALEEDLRADAFGSRDSGAGASETFWADQDGVAELLDGGDYAIPRLHPCRVDCVTKMRPEEADEVRRVMNRLQPRGGFPGVEDPGPWSYRVVVRRALRCLCTGAFDRFPDQDLMVWMCRCYSEFLRMREFYESHPSSVVEESLHRLLFATVCMQLDEMRSGVDRSDEVWDGWFLQLSRWIDPLLVGVQAGIPGSGSYLLEHCRLVVALIVVIRRVASSPGSYSESCRAVLQKCTRYTSNHGPLYGLSWFPEMVFPEHVLHNFDDGAVMIQVDPLPVVGIGSTPYECARAEHVRHLRLHADHTPAADTAGVGFPRVGLCLGPGKSYFVVRLFLFG